MKIQKVKIGDVKVNPNNPRIIKDDKFDKLVKSVVDFPEMLEIRPIVVNKEMIVLGGNMRLKACIEAGIKEIPIIIADNLTPDQENEFLIKDNVAGGEWDWSALTDEWNNDDLSDWGLEFEGSEIKSDEFGTDFELPEGDKSPFQQMTFTLADEQAEQIKNAIADIKATEEYKYCETLGNENTNGNALYLIIMQWAEQRK
jgi:hypothetical protein